MGNNAISPYQQVIEKTKSLSFRSQMLTMNIEKKQAHKTEVSSAPLYVQIHTDHDSLLKATSAMIRSLEGQYEPGAVQSSSNDRLRRTRLKNVEQPSTRTLFTRNKPVRASLTELKLSSYPLPFKGLMTR